MGATSTQGPFKPRGSLLSPAEPHERETKPPEPDTSTFAGH